VPFYFTENPMAQMFPYIGTNCQPGIITAWSNDEKTPKGMKTLTLKQLMESVNKIINKENA
jgi:hypothetical protein